MVYKEHLTAEQWRKLHEKRNKGKAAATEHDLQVSCIRWLRFTYPNILCYAIPNGGYRTYTTACAMVAEGVLSGIPDLHIPMPRGGYASLYIEMKNGKRGVISEHQKAMIPRLQELGNKVVVCRTLEEFQRAIEEYFEV